MSSFEIRKVSSEHLEEYGRIYAAAFSGEPWNDPWKPADAAIHVREILESRQSYGLECVESEKVVGFILGQSMLFCDGRSFEINDLAVDPAYQGQGIGGILMERLMTDLKEMGMTSVDLITAGEGKLPSFYERYGFTKAKEVILMGLELK